MGSCVPRKGLSIELKNLATAVFGEMDTDGNNCIDVEETLKFWKNNFAKINATAMFKAVDEDKNQKIDLEEWIRFWVKVKKSGQSDGNIRAELMNIKERKSWVQFKGVEIVTSKS